MADSSNPHPRDAPDAPGVGVWRNHRALALVSFLLSLVYPLGVTLFVLGGGSLVGLTTVGAATPPAYWVGSKLEIVGVPALIAAIISGHMALGRAKRSPLEHAGCGASHRLSAGKSSWAHTCNGPLTVALNASNSFDSYAVVYTVRDQTTVAQDVHKRSGGPYEQPPGLRADTPPDRCCRVDREHGHRLGAFAALPEETS
jgi:hypothetical protein